MKEFSWLFLEADWENVEFYEKMGFSVVRKYFDDYWKFRDDGVKVVRVILCR
jgi:hypothetical protein